MGMIASVRQAVSTGIGKLGIVGLGQQGYEGGRSNTQEMVGWRPRTTFFDNEYASTGGTIAGRAQDLDNNNAWINGGLDRRVESVIGGRIRLSAQPMHTVLGQDHAWRMEWAANTQAKWNIWASDVHRRCDARKKLNFGAQVRLAYLHYCRDGEICAEIRMNSRGSRFNTNVMLLDSERLSNPAGRPNDKYLRNGVEFDVNGAPVAYHIRKRHPLDPSPDFDGDQWVRIPAFTRSGKPKMIHVFNPRRIEQSRGVSKLVEAMVPAKMLDRVDRAEVQASLLSALLSFFVESPAPTSDVEEMLAPGSSTTDSSMAAYYSELLEFRNKSPLSMPNVQIGHLFPGEKVTSPQSNHPNTNYPEFQKFALQKIAGSIGVSYPQLSQNWSDINYSSARALLNEMWRSFMQDRDYFTQAFCTPIYAAWMEEAVALGEIEVPGGAEKFYSLKTELTMCEWIGPSRGSIDPLKEANANNLDTAAGRKSTVEDILERNREPLDLLSEEAWYLRQRELMGLSMPNHNTKASAEGDAEGGSSGADPADRDNDGIPNEDQKKKPNQQGGRGQ
jgi:lambda family phage portal protein